MARPTREYAVERERFVEDLLEFMTLDEKLGQLVLRRFAEEPAVGPSADEGRTLDDMLRRGHVTAICGVSGTAEATRLQRIAIQETRLGIPLLFAAEPTRGSEMIMPSPLAVAASWDPRIAEATEATIADEARLAGINWLLGPQILMSQAADGADRAPTLGSSTHLAERILAARIRGIQQSRDAEHWALACLRVEDSAWGPRADRRQTDELLRLVAGILRDSDPGTVALGGAHRTDPVDGGAPPDPLAPLARPGGYEGIDLSEWSALARIARQDLRDPPFLGLSVATLAVAVEDDRIALRRVEDAVRRVLATKYDLGLFRSDLPGGIPASRTRGAAEPRAVALDAARAAIVLLRNERAILPLRVDSGGILVVGTAASDRRLPIGADRGEGASLIDGLEALGLAHRYVPGLALRQDAQARHAGPMIEADRMAIGMAGEAARRSQTVLVALGEQESIGEAQRTLIETLAATNRNIVLVTLGSQPLDPDVAGEKLPAVLHAGQLGSMSGHAIAEVLAGKIAPRGRLPMPLLEAGRTALPLGHGLGYSEVGLSDTSAELGLDRIILGATLHNVGEREATETVQIYLRRPGDGHDRCRELVHFAQVQLAVGESRRIIVEIGAAQLGHFTPEGRRVVAAGSYGFALGLSEARAHAIEVTVPAAVADAMARVRPGETVPTIFGGFRQTGS